MLAATIVSAGQDAVIQQLFDAVAQTARAAWQRSALLQGGRGHAAGGCGAGRGAGARARTWCRGAPMRRVRRVPAAARVPAEHPHFRAPEGRCPTSRWWRGRRASPGAGPRRPWTRRGATCAEADPRARPRRVGRGEHRRVVDARDGDLLARLEWPGKPGVAAAATPLTAAEQARFDAGRTVYQNLVPGVPPGGRTRRRKARPVPDRIRVRARAVRSPSRSGSC